MKHTKIVTWNISGGYTRVAPGAPSTPDIEYYIAELRKLDPDIICLQESHTSLDGRDSLAATIADALQMPYVLNTPASESHIDASFKLGSAIISKHKFTKTKVIVLPEPEMDLYFKDGSQAQKHTRKLLVVQTDDFYIANCHTLPMSFFGYAWDSNELSALVAEIDQVFKTLATPLLLCGDFNYFDPLSIYPTLQELSLQEALPDQSTLQRTDVQRSRYDHILYSSEFEVVKSEVVLTSTSHQLCYAEFII